MNRSFIGIWLFLFILCFSVTANAQDTQSPLPPVLNLVSVEQATGYTILQWTAGGSTDVAGYVIYLYINGEGYAIDTLYQPYATSYTNTDSNAGFYSESYVIAAIDSSDNISALSNFLNTIYLNVSIDTCANNIDLVWNPYQSTTAGVYDYRIHYSVNGDPYINAGSNLPDDTTFSTGSFESYSGYCFYVEASLDNGLSSLSNITCIDTDLPVPPEWINADFASYTGEGYVELSFTIDPLTEYRLYSIERSTDSLSGYSSVQEAYATAGKIIFTDEYPVEGINYYRLAALNSCNEAVKYSNIASTIDLSGEWRDEGIILEWNRYYEWYGGIEYFRILRNNRGYYEEIAVTDATHNTFSDDPLDFIYETGQQNVCYRIIAEEGSNPYYSGARSYSSALCIEQPAKIFVPNTFTPDGNGLNETFAPILSFTPLMYRMIIKDRSGRTLFETKDHRRAWDGRYAGGRLPEDVYIWFLEAQTPEGKIIKKSGTITIIFNNDTP